MASIDPLPSQQTLARQAAEDPRVRFAGERTLLAWIRTGLAMMGFGFVVARFGLFLSELGAPDRPDSGHRQGLSLWIGIGLLLLGIAVNVMAALHHRSFLRGLESGEPYRAPRWSAGIAIAVAMAAVGITLIVYLVALFRG